MFNRVFSCLKTILGFKTINKEMINPSPILSPPRQTLTREGAQEYIPPSILVVEMVACCSGHARRHNKGRAIYLNG